MKLTQLMVIGVAASTLALSSMPYAEEEEKVQAQAADSEKESQVQQQAFVPIVTGAPVVRVGGGSRGQCGDLGENIALDAQPLSWSDTPTLNWSITKAVSGTFVFKLGEAPNKNWDLVTPMVDKTMELSVEEGQQTLSLDEYKVALKEGVEYEWFLALVCDAENRSKDIIVGGTVQH